MKTIIEVTIENIDIDDKYYSFDYTIVVNGKQMSKSEYESDHVWSDDKEGFKKTLEEGEAVKLALEEGLQ